MTKAEQALKAVEEQRSKICPYWNVTVEEIQALYRSTTEVHDFGLSMFLLVFSKGVRFQKNEGRKKHAKT